MKKLLILLSFLLIAGFSLNSCLKDPKTPEPGYNVPLTGTNSTQLMRVSLDLYLQAERAIRLQRDSIIAKNINRPTYTFKIGYISLTVAPADSVTYPKTVTLDFGSDATKAYTGQMIITMKGNMKVAGSRCGISYSNLKTELSDITGIDSIISSGKNSSGYIVSRYNMYGGQVSGFQTKMVNYNGRIIGNYNPATGTNLIDSLELNATDENLAVYKLYSVPVYKLQIAKDCNYFSTGLIVSDIKLNNVLTGDMVFDFGYNYLGYVNTCDSDGALYTYSYINKNYQQQFKFSAKKFE